MRYIQFFTFLVLFSNASFSQNLFFEKVFGGGGSDFARSVKQPDDGNIFVTGYSDSGSFGGFDISLSKLNRYGSLIWTKYYGGSNTDYGLYLNKTHDNSLVIAGETYNSYDESDVIVIKTDTSGNIIWQQIFNDTLFQSVKYIEETTDHGFILSGFKSDSSGSDDIYVIKLDSIGNKQWEKAIGGTDLEYSDMIHQTEDGGYILTSDTRSKGAGGIDVEITKLDSAGNITWDRTYGDTLQNGCQGILITSDKKYLSYGETNVKFNFSPFDFYIEKIDTDGTSLWKQVFGGAGSDAIFSAVETSDKGFMLTGYSSSYSSGSTDLVVIKTDSLGELQWVQSYGDSGLDIGYDIIASADNGFLITGKTYVNNDQYYLLHLNSFGLTGIPSLKSETQIVIYPNPCTLSFNLEVPENINILKLCLYSTDGKQVFNASNFAGRLINLPPNIETGLYFLKIITENGIYYKEVLVSP